ncbi:FtsX-like permease family protein [Roseomonas terrae]|uniref:FtsX-like permease family protein n=1 Tax=Neoroseomonas terrae TaxID=424799 RepID=A0ABS5EMZ5_9PROT|nr:FtsX-like permease family protein [Neoroseomonas terrae]MBR0652406.1 FtsX-like permease family protein [Neoroseomonas terrae]
MKTLSLALRFARRDLRGGVKGLRIVLACLALGVAAITAVGTLRAGIEAGIAADGSRILGGEVEVASQQGPLPPVAADWLAAHSARLSRITSMRAMAVAPGGDRTLVELKAVDDAYPLFGELMLDPPGRLAPGEIVVERVVADRLGVEPGATIRVGDAQFTLRGIIVAEPDKVTSPAILGPRAMIVMGDLPATALVQPGSLVNFEYRVSLPPGTDRRAFADALRAAFPQNGWRIRTADAAAPSVNRFVDRAAFFLTLASLTALLVGGIGVATGVRSWLDQRARTIATLRCLGAAPGVIFATYLMQVLALAAVGIAIGLIVGFGLTALAASALADALPVPPRLGLYPEVLGLAALYGLLTALAFALWPLGRAMEIPGAALFRDALQPAGVRPRLALVAATVLAGLALAVLIVATAENRAFAGFFVGGAVGTLIVFRLGALALMAVARRFRAVRRPALRLGLANLHRPGAPTPLILVSLGIGLTTLAAVALIEGNLRRQISDQLPEAAPSFFFIDIQSDQAGAFDRVAAAQPTVRDIKRVPSLRARIVAVNGVPSEQVRTTPETSWALRGDRGLTYAATPPEGTRIVQGDWWPADYRGETLVSFDANLARGWGVGIGDTITVSVLGRDIPLRIANLRDIAWRGLGLNFTLVASPGLLEAAPHTHIATVRSGAAEEGAVLRAISEAFPNVSGIRVRDALEQVAALLERIGTALSATATLTLAAGALVLAGAVAAGQRRRVRDAVVLKTVGATRAQIRRAFLVEFGLLGTTAGVIAAAVGTAAAWGVVRFVMGGEWVFLPGTLAAVVLACTALTLAFGYAGTALALRARPAPLLRNE